MPGKVLSTLYVNTFNVHDKTKIIIPILNIKKKKNWGTLQF